MGVDFLFFYFGLLFPRIGPLGATFKAVLIDVDLTKIRLSVIAFVTKPLNFQPPQKVMQQFFSGYPGPYFGPTNTNHTKNYQKTTFWALFRIPPQNALQCTTVQCNVL